MIALFEHFKKKVPAFSGCIACLVAAAAYQLTSAINQKLPLEFEFFPICLDLPISALFRFIPAVFPVAVMSAVYLGLPFFYSKYFGIDFKEILKISRFGVLPLAIFILPFFDIPFPQNWNHFLGKIRTCVNFSFIAVFYYNSWLFLHLLDRNGKLGAFIMRGRTMFMFYLALFVMLGAYQSQFRLSGDEPLYYTQILSLAEDRDLNLANNMLEKFVGAYEERQGITGDFEDLDNQVKYAKSVLHAGKIDLNDGKLIIHGAYIGSAIVFFLPYKLFGWFGLVLSKALLLSCALVLCFRMFIKSAATGQPEIYPTWVFMFPLLCPFVYYVNSFYSEALIFCLVVFILRLMTGEAHWRRISAGLLCGFIPWFGTKFLVLCAAQTAFFLIRDRMKSGLFLLCATVMLVAWIYTNIQLFGNPIFMPDNGIQNTQTTTISIERSLSRSSNPGFLSNTTISHLKKIYTLHSLKKTIGLFFDANTGLLCFNPAYFFAITGCMYLFANKNTRRKIAFLWPLVCYAVFIGIGPSWGGYCYPSRHIVSIVPFLWIGFFGMQRQLESRSLIVNFLLAYGFLITLCGWVYPGWLYPITVFASVITIFPIFSYFPEGLPSLAAKYNLLLGIFWISFSVVAAYLIINSKKSRRP